MKEKDYEKAQDIQYQKNEIEQEIKNLESMRKSMSDNGNYYSFQLYLLSLVVSSGCSNSADYFKLKNKAIKEINKSILDHIETLKKRKQDIEEQFKNL